MKITQITVHYGETQSLPEYSNVKPALTLVASLDEDENPVVAEAALWEHAKQSVHAQIDLALELNGKPAKYDPAPRFQVMRAYTPAYGRKPGDPDPPIIVVVFPNEMRLDKEQFSNRFVHANYGTESRKLRYAHAMRVAQEVFQHEQGATLIDCSDGDLSRLAAALPVTVAEPDDPGF